MNKPYIICHMMTSVDGRIDRAMTEQLPGVEEYYTSLDALDALDAPTRISGRVTAALEMACPGEFRSDSRTPLGCERVRKAESAHGYEVVVDTRGTLLWDGWTGDERPLLVLTSEQVSREYLDYLEGLGISYIACGAGIDGRGGMAAVFDGLPMDRAVTPLKLTQVEKYGENAVWLRYAL